jgi:hypothetical protein
MTLAACQWRRRGLAPPSRLPLNKADRALLLRSQPITLSDRYYGRLGNPNEYERLRIARYWIGACGTAVL